METRTPGSGSSNPGPRPSPAHSSSLSPHKRHVRAVAEERNKASTPKNGISRKGILFRKGTKILAPGVGAILLSPTTSSPAVASPAVKKSHRRMDPKEVEQRKIDRERMLKEQRRRNREERREKEQLKGARDNDREQRVIEHMDPLDQDEPDQESDGEKEDPVWVGFREDFFEIVNQLPLEVQRSFSLLKELEDQVQTDKILLRGLVGQYLDRRLGGQTRAQSRQPTPPPTAAHPRTDTDNNDNAEAGPSGYNGSATMDVDEAEVSVLVGSDPEGESRPSPPPDNEPAPSAGLTQSDGQQETGQEQPMEPSIETPDPTTTTEEPLEADPALDGEAEDGPGSPQLEPPSSDPMDIIDIVSDSHSHQGELGPARYFSPEKRSPSVIPATPSPAKPEPEPEPEPESTGLDVDMDGSAFRVESSTDALDVASPNQQEKKTQHESVRLTRAPSTSGPSSSAHLNAILNLSVPSAHPSATLTLLSVPSDPALIAPATTPRSPTPVPPPTPVHPNRQLLGRISALLSTLVRSGEEKSAIARGTYDRVDRQCRSLDQALHTHTIAMQMGSLSAVDGTEPAVANTNAGGGVRRRRRVVESDDEDLAKEDGDGPAGGRSKRRRSRAIEYAEEDGEYEEEDGEEDDEDLKGRRKGRRAGASAAANIVADTLKYDDDEANPNEPRYCYCHGLSSGDMIACDNEDCETEWFHYGCVGITTPPESWERWWCDDCRPEVEVLPAPTASRRRR